MIEELFGLAPEEFNVLLGADGSICVFYYQRCVEAVGGIFEDLRADGQ